MAEKELNQPLALSIIVPVYNAELWLARCLDSLINQTIKDIEIIVIDDKSTDGSLKIMQEYEKKDSRIKAITLETNGGASVARNAGLAMATGEYIGFVDSDDFVDLDFYEKLFARAKKTGADIVKGEAFAVGYDGNKTRFGPKFADIRKNRVAFSYAWWSAIYKRNFLKKNKLDFPVSIIVSQDSVFLLKAVILANQIELVEGIYYHYIQLEEGSLDSRILNTEKLKSNVDGINLMVDFINEKISDDRETYNFVFQGRFKDLLYSQLARSSASDGRLAVIRGAIGLYAKCKYRGDLDKSLDKSHIKLLSEGDEVGLLTHILEELERKAKKYRALNALTAGAIKSFRQRENLYRDRIRQLKECSSRRA